jgi:peptidoglycan/xylan/chitin deacetylase (PgdA/CDA1 family)
MRKFVSHLILISLLCWGATIAMATNSSPARAAAYLVSYATHVLGEPQRPSPLVALTFDDGPNPVFTPQIERILQRYKVSATFFCIGEQVQLYPGLVQRMYRAGEEIGNHTWSHPDLTRLSADAIQWQLRSASVAIQQAIGVSPIHFRPPYGATNRQVQRIASQLGMLQILWTIDTRDWQRPGVGTIVSTVLTHARNGSIIILHDGGGDRSETVQALPQIIVGLRQHRFTFVTMKQLLGNHF